MQQCRIDEISKQTQRKAWPAIGIIESTHGCVFFIIADGCKCVVLPFIPFHLTTWPVLQWECLEIVFPSLLASLATNGDCNGK
jgi:hypothetical protein